MFVRKPQIDTMKRDKIGVVGVKCMEFFEKYKDEMISFVKEMLISYDTAGNQRKTKIRYSRFEHTMRVYKWMERLYAAYPNREKLDLEVLSIATEMIYY